MSFLLALVRHPCERLPTSVLVQRYKLG